MGYAAECISVVEDPSKEEIKKHYGLLRDKKDLPVIVGAKRENCERACRRFKEPHLFLLEDFSIQKVIVNGKIIAEEGKLVVEISPPTYPEWVLRTIRMKRAVTPGDLIFRTDKKNETKVRVIKVFEDQIVSVQETETLPVKNGEILPDPTKDILKIAMIERYGKTELDIGKGFVRGFGFTRGAIATSIAPDVHQIIAVGADNTNMSRAVNRLVEIQGGDSYL